MVVAMAAAGGCTSVDRSFDGYGRDQVWTAMVAAAETPAYVDWKVATNDVWVDEADRRIEIYRNLRRVLYRPGADPLRETRTWRFEVRLDEGDPPTAIFVSRGAGLPTDAQHEANRYFLDVQDLLLGVPETEGDDALLNSLGADDAEPRLIDIEAMDEPGPY
jgi:hypothetical protein